MNDDADKVSMAQAVKNMLENMPALMEFERVNARLTRAKYLALVEQGFTKDEALALCKKE